MKKSIILGLASFLALGSLAYAEQPEYSEEDLAKAPWLKGVTIDMVPKHITPVIPLKIYQEGGVPIPKHITEDEPLYIQAEGNIFYDEAPTDDNGTPIVSPAWESNPIINWQIIDWEKNKNTTCKAVDGLAINSMIVIPPNPTDRGTITCNVGRRMSYYVTETGKTKYCFANSSTGYDVKIRDITPPACGLEISIKDGPNGTIYPFENPPDHYPLPKTADLSVKGGIFNGDPDYESIISGLVLGKDMVAPQDDASVLLSKTDKITIKVIGDDNHKLNTEKLRFGICNGAGGQPAPICEENLPEYDLSQIDLQEDPHIYLYAVDMAGNEEILFIPIRLK